MNSRLDFYRGRLTAAQVASGINAAVANARRLAEDAARLLEAQRYPSAASLASLSIEESGKVSVLREVALARSDEDAKEAWKRYRSHTAKNAVWIFPQLVSGGARQLDEFRVLFDATSDHPSLLDQVKQLGFYTDCLGNAHWAVPETVISPELAQQLVDTARVLGSDRIVTEREITLWIEHLGPVWRKDLGWMKQAVINWQRAMHAEGLTSVTADEMEAFVRGK